MPPGGQHVVQHQHPSSGAEGVLLDLDRAPCRTRAAYSCGPHRDRAASSLADQHEPDPRRHGDRCGQHEAAGLDADGPIDPVPAVAVATAPPRRRRTPDASASSGAMSLNTTPAVGKSGTFPAVTKAASARSATAAAVGRAALVTCGGSLPLGLRLRGRVGPDAVVEPEPSWSEQASCRRRRESAVASAWTLALEHGGSGPRRRRPGSPVPGPGELPASARAGRRDGTARALLEGASFISGSRSRGVREQRGRDEDRRVGTGGDTGQKGASDRSFSVPAPSQNAPMNRIEAHRAAGPPRRC